MVWVTSGKSHGIQARRGKRGNLAGGAVRVPKLKASVLVVGNGWVLKTPNSRTLSRAWELKLDKLQEIFPICLCTGFTIF